MSGKFFLFAYDRAAAFEGNTWKDVFQAVNRGLAIIKSWYD